MAKKKKNAGGTVAATAVAAVTAAGVLVGGAYASPDDLMHDGPQPVVQTLVTDSPQLDDGGGADADDGVSEEETDSEEEKRGVHNGVRRLVRAAPAKVRALVAVPLWAIGTGVTALASALWSSVLSPAAAQVLSWLGVALMAALVFTLAVKTAFPDLPLKKILNRRSLLCIGVLCLFWGIADAALPLFWDDYRKLSAAVRIVGSLVCTGVPVAFFVRRHNRRKPEEIVAEPVEVPAEEPEDIPEPTPGEKEQASRELVRELADSVCPRSF